jgi:hypothetical protein
MLPSARIATGLATMLVAGFAAWLGLAGCTPLRSSARDAGDPAVTLFVVRNSWHMEVGFATADLEPPLAPVSAQFAGARYLLFGFGDRHYFLAKNRNAPVLLGALWPGPALVLVTALTGAPAQAYPPQEVAELRVSAAQAHAIQSFIRGALSDVSPYAKGPYEGSLYYAARQRYSALHTCNTWAAEALRAGDLPVPVRGVIFAGQLWPAVHKLGQPRVPAATSP